jgi:hypothetical protein
MSASHVEPGTAETLGAELERDRLTQRHDASRQSSQR